MKDMKHTAERWLAIAGVAIAGVVWSSTLAVYAQATSRLIPFAGIPTTLTPETSVSLTLQLWDQAIDGTLIVAETQPDVSVAADGTIRFVFGSVLGGLNPIDFPSGASRFLDVVDPATGTSVLTGGRIALNAVGFALSPGPQGLQGERGLQGELGPRGEQGPPGTVTLPFDGAVSTPQPALSVSNTGSGTGIVGRSLGGGAGVFGESTLFNGVRGVGHSVNHGAVVGVHEAAGIAVYGTSRGTGVQGDSTSATGVGGFFRNTAGGFGVFGQSSGNGVVGISLGGGAGVFGDSAQFNGVRGVGRNVNHGAVVGVHVAAGIAVYGTSGGTGVQGDSTSATGVGGFFRNTAGGLALAVVGTARVGVLQITGGGDLAETFEITGAETIQPGLVVAIDPQRPGHLRMADKPYDRTVAGIISGANGINPGLTMKQEGTVADGAHPVALTGRVYCWVDASNGPIQPGDLLTTSDTPGHAMAVTDHAKAQGAIIGKAMTGLTEGKGLVLVLVSLQ